MNQLYRALHMPLGRLIKKIIGYEEIYTVAVRKADNSTTCLLNNTEKAFVPLPYLKDFWYADPFLMRWKGRDYLLVEAFDQKEEKGVIAVSEIGAALKGDTFQTVISEDYHLSFPMVFEWNGEMYMIPETGNNRSLNLYKKGDSPYEWKLVAEKELEYPLVDVIVMEKTSDSLILLGSEVSDENGLLVTYSWCKLVKTDKDSYILQENYNHQEKRTFNLKDRNAGLPYMYHDKWYLVTQESSEIDYGVYLNFREMKEKKGEISSESTFHFGPKDVKIEGIDSKKIIGIHTFNSCGDYEVIDARYLKYTGKSIFKRIMRKMRKR